MFNRRLSTPFFVFMAVTLVVPFAAKSASVELNGTCEVNPSCTTLTAIGNGQSTSGSLNFTYSFANGDTYAVTGTYAASYSTTAGSTIAFDPVVTYTGAGPSAGTDTLTLQMLQDYLDATPGSWAGSYTETVPLTLSSLAASGSTISGELMYDSLTVGLIGPFGIGTNTGTKTTALDFGALDTSNTLHATYNIYITFAQGSRPGASGASPAAVPEPALIIPGGLCLLALVFLARRQNRSRVAQ
jgi:hypothetical protein